MEYEDPKELLIVIAKTLDNLGIPYFVTGGMAVLIWGRSRFTADIDIVIQLKERDVDGLLKALRALGKATYVDEYALRQGLLKGGEFNFIDGVSGVKVDFWLPPIGDRTTGIEFERRISRKVDGEKVYFVSPEDLILKKAFLYGDVSSKQIEDIESIFKTSGDKLDFKYLKDQAKKLGVSEILKKFL